ncbi:MAG TPA: short-chain dehydrogenase [Acidimicrobiaceae bacterium]|nr:short-chain dehydrogenase [Acidimicrobiaceae bacterium]
MNETDPNRPLADRVALVTGAASGIGRATAIRFVHDGATVVAADIDTSGLDRLAAELGPSVHPVECDVTSESSVESACAVAAPLGGLHIAVANAGRGTYSPIVDHPTDEWRSIIDLCLTGVYLTVKHAARAMRDGGSIITISSLNGTQPSAGMSAYCAAKAGVMMFTKVAAMELGARGIRVNAIAPGLVETNATSTFFLIPGVVDEFVENTTLGRFAQPDDIAAMAAFLAGPDSGFVSGAVMAVDGGASTKRYPDLPAAFARLGGANE